MNQVTEGHGRHRVGLVTEELPFIGASGGIGAAFHELAIALAQHGSAVTIVYVPTVPPDEQSVFAAQAALRMSGVRLAVVNPLDWTFSDTPEGRSYGLCRFLTDRESPTFDVLHFHEFKGLGFFYLQSVRLGMVPNAPLTVVQLHGPTRWTLEENNALFSHPDQLKVDWMEWRCIALADRLVSPSRYLADYVNDRLGGKRRDIAVIKNVFRSTRTSTALIRPEEIDEIVFFGRHESRKGFTAFCDALDALCSEIGDRRITVTFLGNFGRIADQHSGLYLLGRARRWPFPIRVLPGVPRDQAMRYLKNATGALVVVPSPRENSPYTVLEAIACGRPTLTSSEGGAGELMDPESRLHYTCNTDGASLAESVAKLVTEGCPPLHLDQTAQQVMDDWLSFHNHLPTTSSAERAPRSPVVGQLPLVSVIITHFERPVKLLSALDSLVKQDYPNLEIIVVDDGSRSEETRDALERLEPLIQRVGATLVRRENGYLGAARNTGLKESTGDLVLFLDDDDIALPNLVSTLVSAHLQTKAPVLVPLNLYMSASRRVDGLNPSLWQKEKVNYVPLGGPLALAPIQNVFGAATGLFSREAIASIGGYTEIRGVGHEDYELFARLAMAGTPIEIVPVPLYLYEVDAPSMITSTSAMANFRRVLDWVVADGSMEQFADMIALVAGQNASALGYNRVHYEYARSEEPEDSLALLDGELNDEDSLTRLRNIALNRGNGMLAGCLEASIELGRRLQEDDRFGSSPHSDLGSRYLLRTHPFVDRSGGGSVLSEIALASVDLARWPVGPETASRLLVAVDGQANLLPGDAHWLRALPWHELVKADDQATHQLVKKVQVRIADYLKDSPIVEVNELVVLHAWLADFASEYGRSGLALLIDLDSEQYLADYADISAAIEQALIHSALEHYVASGRYEGRRGFDLSRSYARLEGVDADHVEDWITDVMAPMGNEVGRTRQLLDRLRLRVLDSA